MMSFKAVFLAAFLFVNHVLQAGFPGDTLIKTPSGFSPISSLKVGDSVTSYDFGKVVTGKVIATMSATGTGSVVIEIEDNQVTASKYQSFYVASEKKWIAAKNLKVGDLLLKENGKHVAIKKIVRRDNESLKLFNISVKDSHNYFVSNSSILTHNFFPFVAIALTYWFGASIVEVAILGGLAVAGMAVGLELARRNREDGWDPSIKLGTRFGQTTFGGSPSPRPDPEDDEEKKKDAASKKPRAKDDEERERENVEPLYEKYKAKGRTGAYGKELKTLSPGEILHRIDSKKGPRSSKLPWPTERKLLKKLIEDSCKEPISLKSAEECAAERARKISPNLKKEWRGMEVGHALGLGREPSGSLVGGHCPRWVRERVEGMRTHFKENGMDIYKVMLKGKKKPTTLFPPQMNEHDIINAVIEAWEDAMKERKPGVTGTEMEGTAKNGLKIAMKLRKDGYIISAYPKVKKP